MTTDYQWKMCSVILCLAAKDGELAEVLKLRNESALQRTSLYNGDSVRGPRFAVPVV
jgi:hypothetical protein